MTERFPDQNLELTEIKSWFQELGCTSLFVKELAWNHDSKRQIYLATDLSPFNQFPNRMDLAPPNPPSIADSKKPKAKGNARIFGSLNLSWLSPDLSLDRVKHGKLIFYPQYPETRLSGFLKGTKTIPSQYLREKSGEVYKNRLLFLGTDRQSITIAFLAVGHDDLLAETRRESGYDRSAGLNRLETSDETTSEERLLSALRRIHSAGWHNSVRLKKGALEDYEARNSVGYTLEAHLGIEPNGDNEPDFEGYEVKALTLKNPKWSCSHAVTLMTPEPDLGMYCKSIIDFLKEYGYEDQNGKPDRRNFGGVYRHGNSKHHLTGLLLDLVGYPNRKPGSYDQDGIIQLIDDDLVTAAGWSFQKLLSVWKNKHARAVYILAEKQKTPHTQYRYFNEVQLSEGGDFIRFLECVANGKLYLDPGLKAENWNSGKPKIKKRNQFRMNLKFIPELYETSKIVSL